jgi:predicted enzyme related to lactoylglutathione lyase
MQLAKPALDIGLYTNDVDAMLAFWQEQVHVEFTELLKVGGGLHQHRHAIGDSVLKINNRREPVEASTPSGMSRLEIFTSAVDDSVELIDPDGNEVTLSPIVDSDLEKHRNLTLHMQANNLDQAATFYADVLDLEPAGPHSFAVGASQIDVSQGEIAPIERAALGYRYMTMQVFDVVATHAKILSLGGTEGSAPVRLGEVAYISFIRDPDGNWIEISQRKSITGSLE